MTMRNHGLVKTFNAGAAIARSRIVKFGADERTVIQAAAASDSLIGVCDDIAGVSGEAVDVVLTGVATVEYGGNVTVGALLISDANGKAIAATAAAGTNTRTIGVAMVGGASGDLGAVLLSPGSFQG